MPKLSKGQFLDKVAEVVATRFPLVKTQCDPELFAIRINGHWTRLENLYRAFQRQPEHLEHGVARWVVELLRAAEGNPDGDASFQELRPRIYPMVLSAGPRDVVGMPMVTQPFLDELNIAYALDSDRTIAYIPRKVFKSWNITVDELHEAALENLKAASQNVQAQAAQDESGQVNMVMVQSMDGYDASRILLPDLHDRLRSHLGSPFVAAIPNRDLLLCFRNDMAAMELVRKQVMLDFRTMPHQVSDHLFLITADGVAPYT